MPAVEPPPVGHASYALPAFPNGAQAALLKPNSAAESHDTTVYGRAVALSGANTTTRPQATATKERIPLRVRRFDVTLVICPYRSALGKIAPQAELFRNIASS